MSDGGDSRSWPRWLARLSILAAFLSCTLNCVFSQVASRAGPWLGRFGWLVDWSSLLVVLAGATLGVVGLVGGRPRRSPETQAIAGIGLVLNLGILFVVVWYFTMVRP
jgi:hypothetical protein